MLLDRRTFVLGSGVVLAGFANKAPASEAAAFQMWRSPGCTCCLQWAKRVETFFGRSLSISEHPDMGAVKRAHGVPEDLYACHTALIGNVVVEGHVPPEDIRRMMGSGQAGVGLATPGMPVGAPGMDVGHDYKEPYTVYAFNRNGKRSVFAQHGG